MFKINLMRTITEIKIRNVNILSPAGRHQLEVCTVLTEQNMTVIDKKMVKLFVLAFNGHVVESPIGNADQLNSRPSDMTAVRLIDSAAELTGLRG